MRTEFVRRHSTDRWCCMRPSGEHLFTSRRRFTGRKLGDTPDAPMAPSRWVYSCSWCGHLDPNQHRAEPRGVTEVDEQAPVQQGPDKP